jgi:NAD(P)H dehydrogenase (quinone)
MNTATSLTRSPLNHNLTLNHFLVVLVLGGLLAIIHPAPAGEPPPPKPPVTETARVLVVYYSATGNTEKMAEAVIAGIKRVAGAAATLKNVEDAAKADLEAADAIILGCPTYFGDVPGKMKTFMDDWNWKWKVDFTDKIGGAFATGGGQVGGKEHTVIALLIFMLQNRMVVAGPLYTNQITGSIWGEMGAAAMTGPLDPGVGEGELDSARRLGERIARLAVRARTPSVVGKPPKPGA